MTPIDFIYLLGALLWGGVLGLFHFGGLWWTLRRLPAKPRPKLWLGFSFLARMAGVILGFWVVLRADLRAFFVTLGAFFIVRIILTRKIGRMG